MEKYVKWEEFKELMKSKAEEKDWFGDTDARVMLREKVGLTIQNAHQVLMRAKLGKLKMKHYMKIKQKLENGDEEND